MAEKSSPRRTQAERRRASREKIIREASRLFAEYGYRGAKLAEIAQAVGMSEPGLLHHFPSKEHLLIAVLEERDRVDRERFGQDVLEERRNLLEGLRALVAHNETVPGLVQLFIVLAAESLQPDHPAHGYFSARYQQVRDSIVELLRQSQQRGEIRNDVSAEELAAMVVALMDGLQIQWLFHPEQVKMSAVFDAFLSLLKVKTPEKSV
ncbi:TetR/AcrR family transcriptional regulator [Anaerolinea thermophila]|uniref:TetR family transcriptional regulator n=2 Tax=Anaerolinea TaxID=233189 RepID=E8MZK3_ANATU|nr:TetR/AcrR family transcriptional regulator [Anaerolinea thermophila]BAJ64551.1 TetR family transcriptional regulator [Anaerolinea thermophila UNI-1]